VHSSIILAKTGRNATLWVRGPLYTLSE
jgi:hypothetical protein